MRLETEIWINYFDTYIDIVPWWKEKGLNIPFTKVMKRLGKEQTITFKFIYHVAFPTG